MISLTKHPDSNPESFTFDKTVIIIGAESSPQVDISFTGENLQPVHVKIQKENDSWFVVNNVNDPFVTLNSLPFGKKKLSPGDLLQIGKSFIRYEGTLTQPATIALSVSEPMPSDKNIDIPTESVNISEAAEVIDRTIENVRKVEEQVDQKPIERFYPAENFRDPDETLWREVEALVEANEESQINEPQEPVKRVSELKASTPPPIPRKPSSSISQRALAAEEENHKSVMHSFRTQLEPRVYDLDEEGHLSNSDKDKPSDEIHGQLLNWNLFFLAFVAILLVATLIAGGVYVSLADKREIEKVTASAGVSDVAMALTYAQVNHIKPQKHNWSDTDFLKNNLSSILTPDYPSFTFLDNFGQFTNCPYILRIYTSNDLSHFIIIAQPEPSILQWLLPKTAIVVDSREMELRSIQDLKILNRLLLNPTTLDSSSAREISSLVKQGTLIPLNYIASKQKNSEFAPPKALSLIRPGAENRIYNAPRYYHFGEVVLQKAIALLDSTGSGYEVARVKGELSELSRLSNLVLYTSQGMNKAIQAQKAISLLSPQHQFLTAYLNFNKEGYLTSSHLLLDEQHAFTDTNKLDKAIAIADQRDFPDVNALPIAEQKLDNSLDRNHPLFLQLVILSSARQQALKPISDKINQLLNENYSTGVTSFSKQMNGLLSEYERVDNDHLEIIRDGLLKLYQEYSNLPLAQFSGYVKAAGLELISKEIMSKPADEIVIAKLDPEHITSQLQKIEESKSFEELEANVQNAGTILTLANIPNSEQLIRYQNEMRVLALKQVRKLILEPNPEINANAFTEENRSILARILQTAWVNDEDEYEYYLSEFDLRQNTELRIKNSESRIQNSE